MVFGVGFLIATEFAHEFAGATLGNRAQVVNRFLLAHADTVVSDGDGFGVFVETHANLELRLAFKQGCVIQRFVAQFVASVGSIGDEFA